MSIGRVVVGHDAVPGESTVEGVVEVELFGSALHVPVYGVRCVIVSDVDAFDVGIPVGWSSSRGGIIKLEP